MNNKTCNKCKEIKSENDFYFRIERNQFFTICKSCDYRRSKEYRKQNRHIVNARHRKYINVYRQQPHIKEKRKMEAIKDNQKNGHKRQLYRKRWWEANKNRINQEKRIENSKKPKKPKIDAGIKRKERRGKIQYRLTQSLSRRVKCALNGKDKSLITRELLGCNIEEFKIYLESKFQEGMNWHNYGTGKNKWSLDHILPCELFDLTDEQQQFLCFHYKNVQPLWSFDNSEKNDILPNGKFARNLSKNEKIEYLETLGYSFTNFII